MLLTMDLTNFYTRMKSCWLLMIKNHGIKIESLLIITTVAPSICKFYMLWSNIVYFRLLKTADLEDGVRRRIAQQGSRPVTEEMSLLLTHAGEKVWGEKRIGNKVAMVGQIVGFKPKINTGKDAGHAEVHHQSLQDWPGYADYAHLGAVPACGCSSPRLLDP